MRVLAATNRAPETLKSDFLARFTERLSVPGLNERRADVPLLARHLLARICAENPADGASQIGMALTDALVRHQYRLHHRELERLLRLARRHSPSRELGLSPEVEAEFDLPLPQVDKSADAVRAALAASKNASEAAKRLGLPSRFALHRLLKRLGIEPDPVRKGSS
jgi:DNA-binding NtrC family response regulator